MVHYSYLDELNKKTRRIKVYWLFLIVTISIAIISLLVIIRNETNFFVDIQESKNGLTNEDKKEIEDRLLAGWARKELGLDEREKLEAQILGDQTSALDEEEKLNIEKRLIQ